MKLKNEYLIREFNGTIYAVRADIKNETRSEPIVLNDTGRILWHMLMQGAEVEDLVGALTAEYDIDEQRAAEDVKAFTDELIAADLVQ